MQMCKKQKAIALILLLGFIYAVIVRYTSFCIPCFFQTLTGLKCPGCGITHFFLSIMKLDFYNAYLANRFLFITSPILAFLLIINLFFFIFVYAKPIYKWLAIIYAISLFIWGIARNILNI